MQPVYATPSLPVWQGCIWQAPPLCCPTSPSFRCPTPPSLRCPTPPSFSCPTPPLLQLPHPPEQGFAGHRGGVARRHLVLHHLHRDHSALPAALVHFAVGCVQAKGVERVAKRAPGSWLRHGMAQQGFGAAD